MRLVPRELWPALPPSKHEANPLMVWRDADFLATLYPVPGSVAMKRLTVVRAAGVSMDGRGRIVYRDGITWDDLMQVKRACGFGDVWAVEIYPDDKDLVDVANMRHLWLMREAPAFAWRKTAAAGQVAP